MAEKDAEFVEFVVKSIVDNPDDVKAERKVDEMGVLITLHVHSSDMGMVIGKDGTTAKALRTLLRVVGARNNARVNLKISEPEGGRQPRKEEKVEKKEAPKKEEKAEEKKKEEAEDLVSDLKL